MDEATWRMRPDADRYAVPILSDDNGHRARPREKLNSGFGAFPQSVSGRSAGESHPPLAQPRRKPGITADAFALRLAPERALSLQRKGAWRYLCVTCADRLGAEAQTPTLIDMCGRFYRHYVSWEDYRSALELIVPDGVDAPEAKYNIAPMTFIPIIIPREHAATGYEMIAAQWSLVPSWWRKPLSEKKFTTFNARSETINESNTFKGPFRHHRCIIPMSGYYEWSGEKGSKQPFAISLRNRRWFACAGLWNRVMIEGSELDTFTLITTTPNDATAGIHSRMPVILNPRDYEKWMRADYSDVYSLMRPCPAEDIDAWPVRPDVGNVRNQGPHLIEEA